MNRSTFNESTGYLIDTFPELAILPPSMIQSAERLATLRATADKTEAEVQEMNQLTIQLQNYEISPEVWNKLCDAIVNMETYIKEKVYFVVEQNKEDISKYIIDKKSEMKDYIDKKKLEIDEVDSKVKRYWQRWLATSDGQSEFNIFQNGTNLILPSDATLDIQAEDIDCSVNGVTLSPYQDFDIKKDGLNATIVLNGDSSKIKIGSEVVIRYYKYVGKLYLRHATSHEYGSTDPITVSENMLDESLKKKLGDVYIGTTAPTKPALLWVDIS